MKRYWIISFLVFVNYTFCQNQDDRSLQNEIDSIYSYAKSYYDSNQIILSYNSFNKVKKISDSVDHSYGKAISNFYLGNIYNLMEDYNNAEISYNSALEPSIAIRDNFLTANAYLNIGRLNKNKNIKIVESHLEKALMYALKYDRHDAPERYYDLILQIRLELCDYYLSNDLLDKAQINLLRLEQDINNENNATSSYYRGYYSYVYGLFLVKKEFFNRANLKFNEAIEYLKNGDLRDSKNSLLLSKAYKELSLSSSKTGDKKKAYDALLIHNDYNNQYAVTESAKYKSMFQNEVNKHDVKVANNEKLKESKKAETFENINIIITIISILLAISLITLLKNYISKRELTETLKNQNTELELAKNEALKSSELKSKFISNVTHELRTPLYGVVGITSLLLSSNSMNKKDSKFLKSLKYSGDYLLNLVNEVLQFGKIESEEIVLNKVSVEIKQLLENIVGSFDYKLQETNNQINMIIDERIPKYIECDNIRLSQVLINLIGNAIKFTKNGVIGLEIKVLHLLDENVDLRFEIKDTGVGIPKEKFDTIFENFSQLENSNINYQGTGLGLSISKKIIELFGSKIELKSEYGKGSVFSFNATFKFEKEVPINLDIIKSEEDKIRTINNYKILIAEDNKINQIVTKNLLEKQNYDCVVVENGAETVRLLQEQRFNLVLMDINMPIMGGIEATKLIRNFNTEIPIIALTAADVAELKDNHKKIGFNGIITKPFDNYEFYQIIQTAIQNSNKFKGKLKKLN